MSYRSLTPFYDVLFGRMPERPLYPPEPSARAQYERECAEFMAGEDFDDMKPEVVEYVLDDPDLIESILRATVTRSIYGDESRLLKEALHAAIDKARQDYIAFKTGR